MIPRTVLGPRSHTVPPFSSSRPRVDLARDFVLAETILNRGGTTQVPEKVMEALGLKPKPGDRSKLLWTAAEDSPQRDFRSRSSERRHGPTLSGWSRNTTESGVAAGTPGST